MRRFLITSQKFTGTAELLYNDQEVLNRIDCTQTDMSADTVAAFKRAVPVLINALLKEPWCGADTTIIEADFEVSFLMFWKRYDKKINKKRAQLAWNKLSKSEQVKAFYGIDAYTKFLKIENWRPKQDPENYLKNLMWENEYK